jgi:hypothetical protein
MFSGSTRCAAEALAGCRSSRITADRTYFIRVHFITSDPHSIVTLILTTYRTCGNSFLQESAVNVEFKGQWNPVLPNSCLSQLKRDSPICIPHKHSVSVGVFVLTEGKVLLSRQLHVTNQYFLNWTLE